MTTFRLRSMTTFRLRSMTESPAGKGNANGMALTLPREWPIHIAAINTDATVTKNIILRNYFTPTLMILGLCPAISSGDSIA